jgi:hypothetical protein
MSTDNLRLKPLSGLCLKANVARVGTENADCVYMRRTAGYTRTEYKTNTQIAKELKITPILDILLVYKCNWIQRVNRMPPNRLPRLMKHCSPIGRRNHGRPLKRLLDTWDRNGSTSGPTPWHMWWWWWWWGVGRTMDVYTWDFSWKPDSKLLEPGWQQRYSPPVLCYRPTVLFRHIRNISFCFSARKNSVRIPKRFCFNFLWFKNYVNVKLRDSIFRCVGERLCETNSEY